MMHRALLSPLLLMCLSVMAQCVFLAQANAQDANSSAWFFSMGGGSSTLEPEGESAGFTADGNTSSATKLVFGQKLAGHYGWEVSYLDAGDAELSNLNPAIQALVPDAAINYKITTAFANYNFQPDDSRFNVVAKLGAAAVDTSPSDNRIIVNTESSVQVAYGFGAEMRFGQRWFLRLEHDRYSKDADYTGVLFGTRFGGKAPSYGLSLRPRNDKPLPVVIEYPLYIPEEQVTVLSEDRDTVSEVADEIKDISEDLLKASSGVADVRKSKRLAQQSTILVRASERIAIVEESIIKTNYNKLTDIDVDNFVNEKGQKLLATPAEQSAELGKARTEIRHVQVNTQDMPYVNQRLARVRGRIAVVEESLLFIPPWEEEQANVLCGDFAGKQESIQFNSESTRLTPHAESVLRDIVEKMNRNPRVIMEVHAHTDSWGTYAFNQILSERRARITVDYLVEQGVARARLLARGYGEWKPVADNREVSGRANNRRVEFVIKNPNICKPEEEKDRKDSDVIVSSL